MNPLEIIALISTIVCVILSTKEHILAWPIGIISALSLAYIYLPNHMYANIALQSVFVIQCIIGWYNWGKKDDLKPSILPKSTFRGYTILVIGLGSTYALTEYDKSLVIQHIEYWKAMLDGISTSIALLGNWYLTKKRLQAWPLFMTYNIIVALLLISQGVYLIAGLNIVLFFISFNGYRLWKRNLSVV